VTNCRVCASVATEFDLDGIGLPLCSLHHRFLEEVIETSLATPKERRAIGLLRSQGQTPDLSYEFRCDKSSLSEPHSEIGPKSFEGRSCYDCLAIHLERLREERAKLLAPIDRDPEDQTYLEAVRVRHGQLERGIEIGLIERDEALRVFERWVANV